jgi:glutaredoxin
MQACPYCKRVMQTLGLMPPTYYCEACGLTYVIRLTIGNTTTPLTFPTKFSLDWGDAPKRTNVPQVFQDAFEGKVLEP